METNEEVLRLLPYRLYDIQAQQLHFIHQIDVLPRHVKNCVDLRIWKDEEVMFGFRKFVLDSHQLLGFYHNRTGILHGLQELHIPSHR